MNAQLFAADLFCGAGGTSTGLLDAAEALGLDIQLVAINHWEVAIATHKGNHPEVTHFNSDLEKVDPLEAVPSGKLKLLVASPECTHFSRARGGKPMSKQSRSSVKYILRWVGRLNIENVLIENIPEFQDWGPLHRSGPRKDKPIIKRKGEYFHRFVIKLKSCGYAVDWRILNAADYGDPTTRKRLFIMARKNESIHWPEPSHAKQGHDLFGDRPSWKPARDVIDWNIQGNSIYNRKKPLATNTMRRIYAGVMKFGGKSFLLGQQSGATPRDTSQPVPTVAGAGAISLIQPFIMPVNHGKDNRTYDIDKPAPTITAFDALGLCEPFLITTNWGATNRSNPRSVDEPIPTIMGNKTVGLVEPFIVLLNGTNERSLKSSVYPLSQPLPTATGSNHMGLASPFLIEYYGTGQAVSVDKPLPTQTGRDRFGLVEPLTVKTKDGTVYMLDIRFRMLSPRELARAMSFPDSYQFQGNREQVVKQIGNAVPVKLAQALCSSLLGAQ